MFPRITNAFDLNKPLAKVLDKEQVDKVIADMDEADKPMTTKRKIKRTILICLIILLVIWIPYSILFVLQMKALPVNGLSVETVTLGANDTLTFQLKSNSFYLSDNYDLTENLVDNEDTRITYDEALYITLKRPLLSLPWS